MSEPTVKRIEGALMVAAELVACHGEVFAPIFIRLEEELAARRTTQSAVDRARELAARRSRGAQGVNPAGTL